MKAKLGRGFSYLTGMQESLIRKEQPKNPPLRDGALRIATKIGITSGKGGTGKSVLACNIAVCLGKAGKRVVVLDADFGLANDHIIFGVHPIMNIAHMLRGSRTLEEILVVCPEGVRLVPGTSGIEWAADLRGREIHEIAHALRNVESASDIILVDTSAGISKYTLLLLLACDEIVVVTNSDATAMTDAYAISKAIFRLKPAAKVWIAVNRVKDEQEPILVFRKMNSVAQKFIGKKMEYLGFLKESALINESINSKVPFFIKYPFSDISVEVATMGRALMADGASGEKMECPEFFHQRIGRIMNGRSL